MVPEYEYLVCTGLSTWESCRMARSLYDLQYQPTYQAMNNTEYGSFLDGSYPGIVFRTRTEPDLPL